MMKGQTKRKREDENVEGNDKRKSKPKLKLINVHTAMRALRN
eukprot:UN27150